VNYRKTITLKDGRSCLLKSAGEEDAQALLEVFRRTHEETDFLLAYNDEKHPTLEEEREFLHRLREHPREAEILAFVEGSAVACGGISQVGAREKLRHRCGFGVSVERAFWGLGIGAALTASAIECARLAGYEQMELDVVADNERAIALYQRFGFVEYGRNPRGFLTRGKGYQELVLMALELKEKKGDVAP
jgi:RimJ/RimL family protein N-acetyltransferase